MKKFLLGIGFAFILAFAISCNNGGTEECTCESGGNGSSIVQGGGEPCDMYRATGDCIHKDQCEEEKKKREEQN